MSPPRLILLSLFLLISAIASACSRDSGPPTADVVGAVSWPQEDSYIYVLKDSRGREIGRATLSVDVSGDTTILRQLFENDTNRDDVSVAVNSRTLKPESSRRTLTSTQGTEVIEVTYTDQGASIKQGDRQSGLTVPEHSYDNDSSLFLWRTLPFADAYEASYITIITNRRSRQEVTLRVTGRETVRVPAGEFQAWRLEIKAGDFSQKAWYADAPDRRLVKYDNDNGTIFELTGKGQ